MQSEVTLNSLAARSLRSRRVTSMDELKEHGSDDEASDVEWNGDVPDDAKPWCKALHGLITRALGDDCKGSGEPEWWSENDDLFIELEEERREMPRGSLQPFLRQPYHSDIPITEYVTGRNAKVEALLFGTAGEKLGAWEAFTLFYVKPDGAQWRATEVGQKVTVGHYPFDEDAVVARILRATKPGAHGRMQHCYYVLLKVGENFKYAALQHVHTARVTTANVYLRSGGRTLHSRGTHRQPASWLTSRQSPCPLWPRLLLYTSKSSQIKCTGMGSSQRSSARLSTRGVAERVARLSRVTR